MKLKIAKLIKAAIDSVGWSLLMALFALIVGLALIVAYLVYTLFAPLFKIVIAVSLAVWGLALLYEWAVRTINTPQ